MKEESYYIRRRHCIEILGGACVKCGCNSDLEFDHTDPSSKEYNINSILTCKMSLLLSELSKCQLLCSVCHLNKTIAEKKPFVHGTIYSFMKKGCECILCLSKKKEWSDERNRKRRISNGRGPYNIEEGIICGSYKKYKRGCRCLECKAANATKARESRKKI